MRCLFIAFLWCLAQTAPAQHTREEEAAQILNRVLARQPQHPGVTH